MAQPQATTFFHDPDLNTEQGARALSVSHLFSTTGLGALQTFKASHADTGLGAVQMLYIDNSQSPAPTSIILGGTRQTIVAAPFTQGYYRVLGSPMDVDYSIANFGGVTAMSFSVNLQWLNIVPDGAAVWNTQSPGGLNGTPFAASGVGAASAIALTMAAQAGRRSFISTIEITGGGATLGSVVNATLTGVDNGAGGSVTLNWNLPVPTGATLGIVPFVVSFSPMIAIAAGSNAALTVPSFGAGNTSSAASMDGVYI